MGHTLEVKSPLKVFVLASCLLPLLSDMQNMEFFSFSCFPFLFFFFLQKLGKSKSQPFPFLDKSKLSHFPSLLLEAPVFLLSFDGKLGKIYINIKAK